MKKNVGEVDYTPVFDKAMEAFQEACDRNDAESFDIDFTAEELRQQACQEFEKIWWKYIDEVAKRTVIDAFILAFDYFRRVGKSNMSPSDVTALAEPFNRGLIQSVSTHLGIKRGRRANDITPEKIAPYIQSGLSSRAIAKKLGVTRQAVSAYRKKNPS